MARLSVILLVVLGLLAAVSASAAQDAPPGGPNPDCVRVEALMTLAAQTGSKPDQIIQGGGSIRDSTPVQASITAGDAGDRWVFGTINTAASGLTQMTLDTDVPLAVQVFKGLSPATLLQNNAPVSEASLTPGTQTLSVQLQGDGYYTAVVRRQNLTDTSQTGSYTLTLGGNVAGGIPFAQVDWRGQQALAAQQELIPAADTGIVTFSPEPTGALTLHVPADSLRTIQVERSVILELASSQPGARGTLSWVRDYVKELSLLDGSLSIYLNNGGFLYIEDYAGTGRDTFTDEFNNFTLQDDSRSVRGINWDTIQNVWMLPGCIGYELRDGGQRFIAAGTALAVTERPAPSGAAGQTLAVAGGVASYNLTVDWADITRVFASDGVVDVNLSGDRSLSIDRLNVALSQPPDQPFTVTESNGSVTLLRTDWANTQRVEVIGDALRVTVQDLRGVVERRGRVLRTLETRAGTMHTLWQDDSQTLMLPESADFIEIDTPAAIPAYDNSLRPLQVSETSGAVGFLPANLNNAGQECYPVNTVLDFNCAPNGEVNPANGGFSMSVTDLYARGARIDLTLSRTYNSQNALVDGPFGKGWNTDYLLDYAVDYAASQQARHVAPNMPYPVGLDVTYAPLGLVIYTTPSGSRHVFRQGSDGWHSGTMPGWLIAARGDPLLDGWHLAQDSGVIYDFDVAGRLQAIRQIHGSALTVERVDFTLTDANAGSLYRINDGTGRHIDLIFDGSAHVTRSELYDGDSLLDSADYTYSAGGFLTGVTYGDGGSATYDYTETGPMDHHDDPRAPLAQDLHYGYDEQGRVLWMDPSASVTPDQCSGAADSLPLRCYRYEVSNNLLTTTVTGDWGRSDVWTYGITSDPDTAFHLQSHTTPDGTNTTYNYSGPSRFPISFSRAGLQHQLRWDESIGKPTIFQADTWINFSAAYDTDVRIDIDGDGTPDYMLPLLASYQADGDKGPTQPVTYTYDPASGQPVSMTDSSGLVTQITAREAAYGLPTQVTQGTGDSATPITLTYDAHGFVLSRQDATGIDRYQWDAFGRPTHYERASLAGDTLAAYDVTYAITGDGRCMTVTDPLGTQTVSCYDRRSRLTAQTVTDSSGSALSQTTYAYDALDRLAQTVSQTGGDPVTTSYAYESDPAHPGQRLVTETLPIGAQQTYRYDAADRLVFMQDADGQTTTYEYAPPTAQTETVTERTGSGAETTYTYNRARQLIGLDYGPVEWGLLYGGSRASSQREPSQFVLNSGQGASTTVDFDSYDSAGRLTQVSFKIRRPDDNNVEAEPVRNDNSRADMTLHYTYDPQGRLLEISNPVTGESTRMQYAALDGGLQSVAVDNGQAITYTYDALQRLVGVDSPEGSRSYTYSYDTERGLLEVSAAMTGVEGAPQTWLLDYDSQGRLREWRNENGRVTRYAYDQRGRLTSVTRVGADGEEIPDTEYTYNADDKVTTITNRDGLEARYVYNDRGQLTTRRDFDGTVTTFQYDPQGHVQAVSDGLGFTTSYTYDARGQLASVTDPLGRQVTYSRTLGNVGELDVRSDLLGQTRYFFDLYDRLWQISDAQDGQHLLRYNFGGHVSEWRQSGGALSLGFSYGPGGVLTGITGPENWRWSYAYNSLGQLIGRTDPDNAELQLGFDLLGHLTALTAPGGDFARTYDRSQTGVVAITQGDQRALYNQDVFGRLTQTASGDSVDQYEYRDDGYTRTAPDGSVTDYAFTGVLGDPEVPYLIVQDYSPSGELTGERDYHYNQRGDLIGIDRLDYFPNVDAPYRTTERIDYDADGRPIRYIDGESNLYAYSYDVAGRLDTAQYPDGASYRYAYDRLNRLTGLVNPTGQQMHFDYSPLGYLTGMGLNSTPLESYDYSPLGWLLSRTFASYPDGAGKIDYRYDASGSPLGWSIAGKTVTLERSADAFHRLVHVDDGLGGSSADYTYDAAGRLIGAGDQQFAYDSQGRLAALDALTYSYAADSDGESLTVNLPDGQTLNLRLDTFRHIQQADADGQAIAVQYEPLDAGLLEVRLDWGERYTTQMRFNRLGQITLIQFRDNVEQRRLQRFAYTDNYAGMPLAIDDRENDILIGYDNVFRPLTTSWLVTAGLKPTDSVDYAFTLGYDEQGNRVRELRQSSESDVTEIFYTYQNGLLRTRTAGEAAVALSGMMMSGGLMMLLRRRRRAVLPGLLVLTLVGGLLIARAQPAPAYEYHYDDNGHLASITDRTDPAGDVLTTFTYDGFGRLAAITSGEDEDTTTFTYDALGRLIGRESPQTQVAYRYDGDRLISISEDGKEQLIVGLLADQYLLLTDGENHRWTQYDALGAVRQSFVGLDTDDSNITNRFDILGRVLGGSPQIGTPLALPLFDGMLYDADHHLYIGLDGRAYDPATGRYLQRSLTGPDAAGNLYGFTLEPASPPAQIFAHDPLALLNDHAHLLDAPTAESVRAAHLPDLYPGWQEAGLQALGSFQSAQQTAFTDLARHTYALMYDYNRVGLLPDARGDFRLFDLTNPAAPDQLAPRPAFDAPQPNVLPSVALNWSPQAGSPDIAPPRWYDPALWRRVAAWSPVVEAPQPLMGDRAPGMAQSLLPLPLAEVSSYADLFDALAHLPVQSADAWVAAIDGATLPTTPAPAVEDARGWLRRWFNDDTLPVWTQLRALQNLPAAPGSVLPTLKLH